MSLPRQDHRQVTLSLDNTSKAEASGSQPCTQGVCVQTNPQDCNEEYASSRKHYTIAEACAV